MARMLALSRHWRDYPPVHVAVRIALGGKPASHAAVSSDGAQIAELLAAIPEVRR